MKSINRQKSRGQAIRRRVMLYEAKNIIESREINDVLGNPPFCRKRFFLKRQKRVMASIEAEVMAEVLKDCITELYRQEHKQETIGRPLGITFHRKMPYMALLCDRTISGKGKRTCSEKIWRPVFIDVMSEPAFRTFQHNGPSDRHLNVLHHALAVKRSADYAVYIAGCVDPFLQTSIKIDRDPEKILRVEQAVEDMFYCLEENREPVGQISNCDSCSFFRRCIQPKTVGDLRPDLEELSVEWIRAEHRLWEAQKGKDSIESAIRHELADVEAAHTPSANITFKNANRWKIDSERLLREMPDVARKYRKELPERVLRISR